jgi:hypothetical protein
MIDAGGKKTRAEHDDDDKASCASRAKAKSGDFQGRLQDEPRGAFSRAFGPDSAASSGWLQVL